ncbi:MAG: hypothetical protein M3Y77_07245 [Actinomycetota bacterium]|nr:hypothetical protein [Actinomycetota bacterium]
MSRATGSHHATQTGDRRVGERDAIEAAVRAAGEEESGRPAPAEDTTDDDDQEFTTAELAARIPRR